MKLDRLLVVVCIVVGACACFAAWLVVPEFRALLELDGRTSTPSIPRIAVVTSSSSPTVEVAPISSRLLSNSEPWTLLGVLDPFPGYMKSFTILPGPQDVIILSGVWSPDGSTILIAVAWKPSASSEYSALRTMEYPVGPWKDIKVSPPPKMPHLYTFQDAIYSPRGDRISFAYDPDRISRCVYVMNVDGNGIRRINRCERDDRPRFWSVDGKWVIVYNESRQAIAGLEVDGDRRVSMSQLSGMSFYDQRYYPWRAVTQPKCSSEWPSTFQIFWFCS